MPTRTEVNESIDALIAASGSNKVTSAEHRQANGEMLDYVDQEIAALSTSTDSAVEGLQDQIDALPTSEEDATPTTFTGSIKFDKRNRTYSVNASDVSGAIAVDATGAAWGKGATLVIVNDNDVIPEPTFTGFNIIDNGVEYDPTEGNGTAYVFTNIAGVYIGSRILLGVSEVEEVNDAPVASGLAISGTQQEGETLTGTYTYGDAESDAQGTSQRQWYRADNGSGLNRAAISGATGATYVLAAGDVGKFIQFAVTPVALTGTATGTQAVSAYTGAIAAIGVNLAPTATSVTITGTKQQGQTLTGAYTYSDTESDPEGTSTKQWYRADNGSGLNRAAISGATNTTYVLQAGDVGKYIQYGVVPVATSGTTPGTEGLSAYTTVVTALNVAPVASVVAFTGTEEEGETLTGTYTYTDADSDAEGTSLYKWYRSDDASGTNKAAISGATAATYVLAAGDVGKFIQYAVTPVAATGTSPGAEVFSTYSGAIAAGTSGPVGYAGIADSIFEFVADPADLTLTGSLVDVWDNRTGVSAAASGSLRPTYAAAAGGLPDTVHFTGASQMVAPSLAIPPGTTDVTIYMVFAPNTSASGLIMEYGPDGATVGDFSVYNNITGSNEIAGQLNGNGGASAAKQSYTAFAVNYAKIELHRSKASGSEVAVYINGGAVGTVVTANNNTDTFATALNLYLGGRFGPTLHINAYISLMAGWSKILSPSDSATIEAQIVADYGSFTTAF